MNRRDALRTLGAATLTSVTAEAILGAGNPGNAATPIVPAFGDTPLADRRFFLSPRNSTATADQRDMEALALQLAQRPIIAKTKDAAATRLKILVGHNVPQEAWAQFDDLMDEWAFHYVLLALNSDPNYPKVLGHGWGPAHEWFGMKVPGNRCFGADNVDNNYSYIPIDGYARFELHGKRSAFPVADAPFIVTGSLGMTMTLSSLDWRDIRFKPDGSFVITLGPEPADGRPNHLQTKPDARYLFIRDVRGDWRQIPNFYRIKRLSKPLGPPLTIDQMVDRAASYMVDDVAANHWFIAMVDFLDANAIRPPVGAVNIGGLVSQELSYGRLKIADDEAFVVTVGTGGAGYHTLILYNYWLISDSFWDRTSSMNNTQSLPNADGSTTYVISIRDPGVHNWIDAVGLHEPRVLHRWHALPRTPGPEGEPWIKGELVKLNALDTVLPAGTKRVTSSERQEQLADRLAAFRTRYIDS